jgi:hypothetical protein
MVKTVGISAKRRIRCLIWAVLLMSTYSGDAGGQEEPAKESRELEWIVDGFVNPNPRPRIVRKQKPIPIFVAGYDWSKQERILDAIEKAYTHATPEMWEVLVARSDDDRYCLTYASDQGFARNYSVGNLCSRIAYVQLHFPVDESLEQINRERDAQELKRVYLAGFSGPLKIWRAARPAKPFFELQIEVCQLALEQLPDVTHVSKAAKDDCRRRLAATIDKLRQTKVGIFGGFKFPGEKYRLYDEEQAKELRKNNTDEG